MKADFIYVSAAAGHVIKVDLPLHEAMADQLTKGHVRRVNADGSPYTEPAASGEQDQADAGEQPPAASAVKAEWVGYAVRVHGVPVDDAEAMTKADLIERYGTQPPSA